MWIRLSIEESPVFAANKTALESHKSEHAPIIEVLRKYPREVLIAMGLRMVENTAYYIFTIVVMTYMVTYLDLPKSAAIAGVLIASVAQFFLTPLVGALSDRIGRRPLYFTGAVGVRALGFVFFPLIDTENPTIIAAAIFIGLIFTTLMYAPQAAMFSELFGTSVRYSGGLAGLPARLGVRRRAGTLHRRVPAGHRRGKKHPGRQHLPGDPGRDHRHRSLLRQGDRRQLPRTRPRARRSPAEIAPRQTVHNHAGDLK